MFERSVELKIKVKVRSENPISDELMEEFANEVDYNFESKTDGIEIHDTEIFEQEVI